MLDDPVVLLGRRDQAQALIESVRGGFLDIDVLTCLTRPDRRQRVPVVGRRNGDDVDVLVFDDLTQVLHDVGTMAVLLLEFPCALAGDFHIRIDEGRDINVLDRLQAIHVALAAAIHAQDCRSDPVVGPDHAAACRECSSWCSGSRSLDESSSLDCGVCLHGECAPKIILPHRVLRGKRIAPFWPVFHEAAAGWLSALPIVQSKILPEGRPASRTTCARRG